MLGPLWFPHFTACFDYTSTHVDIWLHVAVHGLEQHSLCRINTLSTRIGVDDETVTSRVGLDAGVNSFVKPGLCLPPTTTPGECFDDGSVRKRIELNRELSCGLHVLDGSCCVPIRSDCVYHSRIADNVWFQRFAAHSFKQSLCRGSLVCLCTCGDGSCVRIQFWGQARSWNRIEQAACLKPLTGLAARCHSSVKVIALRRHTVRRHNRKPLVYARHTPRLC
mmetsp:Transcript_56820/g.158226  ORF Transcript_56820/g.158226 Transcript_56820/m.158226 type:complete len:222 (-) Transcript_56820:698-1363(-)